MIPILIKLLLFIKNLDHIHRHTDARAPTYILFQIFNVLKKNEQIGLSGENKLLLGDVKNTCMIAVQ